MHEIIQYNIQQAFREFIVSLALISNLNGHKSVELSHVKCKILTSRIDILYDVIYLFPLVRHSRLPAGNALWVCQNFFFFFLFFRRQGFRMITFDRQAGPLQNFNRSHIMVIGRSVSFSDPARPPGGGVGRPKHPKIPPPQEHF